MNKIVLTIEWTPGESPRISGPVADKLLCYGLLEMAKDAIKEYKPPTIVSATVIPNGAQLGNQRP